MIGKLDNFTKTKLLQSNLDIGSLPVYKISNHM